MARLRHTGFTVAGMALILLLSACADDMKSAEAPEQAANATVAEADEAPGIVQKSAESAEQAHDVAGTETVQKNTEDASVIVENGQRGETVDVGIVSWRDLPFKTVKHQAYDYSCGSAAVATLVTYTYGMPTSEKAVFEEMFAHGDQDKIRQQGFSMLDMSRYLNDHGLEAKGFKITQKGVENYHVPIIALVNNKGYNHFVVVKTIDNDRILVGDPNTGNTEYSREAFAQMWGGLALIVTNHAIKAHEAYADANEWNYAHAHAPRREGNDYSLETAALAPMQWQIAPTGTDLLSASTIGVATTTSGGGL